ncbi:hypothetical protein V8C86DRAFT_2431812 [Haematococcus lacustris]
MPHKMEGRPLHCRGRSSKKSEVRMSRRYVDRSLKKLYLEYERECPANLKVGSTAFEILRPPWVKRITAAHKQEAVTGETAPGAAELQSAIKRATPLGWVFKGAPSFHLTASAPAVAAALLGDASVLELLALAAGVQGVELSCRWPFRSRVQLYPEGLFAVWVMLAVKFRDTATVGSGHGG